MRAIPRFLPQTLRSRVLSVYLVSLLASSLVFALVIWIQFRQTVRREFEHRGAAIAHVLATNASLTLHSGELDLLRAEVALLVREEGVRYVIVQDGRGDIVAQAISPAVPERWMRSRLVARSWRPVQAESFELPSPDGGALMNFVAPLETTSATGVQGFVRFGLSSDQTFAQMRGALGWSLGCGVALSGLGLVVLFFLTGWALRPLRRMAEVARGIARGDLSQRVGVDTNDEVGELARVFDEMSGSLAQSRAELARRNEELSEAIGRLAHSEESRRQDRLRTVGQMASGIAHNFNNILSVIIGRVQVMRIKMLRQAASPAELEAGLGVIEHAGLDGAETVRRMQEFSRGESSETFVLADLNDIVRGVVEITRPRWKDQAQQAGAQIELTLDLGRVPPISCAPTELREVLTNLIFNSVDAMPQGGEITIRTETTSGAARVVVRDTGAGMSARVRERIFDPFYTTKGVSGTGLGLSTVFGIVKRHRGVVEVESEEGRGTSFIVTLPVESSGSPQRKEDLMSNDSHWRVLVGDDEANVREVLAELLRLLGHEVCEASGGLETVERFREGHFDLVFTDLGMPDLNGWEVATEIRKLDLRVPIVLATGWGTQIDRDEAQLRGITRVLAKPFTVQKISSLVAELQGQAKAA